VLANSTFSKFLEYYVLQASLMQHENLCLEPFILNFFTEMGWCSGYRLLDRGRTRCNCGCIEKRWEIKDSWKTANNVSF